MLPPGSLARLSAISEEGVSFRKKLAVYILHPPVALGRIDYQPGTDATFHSAKAAVAGHDFIRHLCDGAARCG
jgi:hypothetical protein